jgi:hypothetical protein
MPRLRPPKSKTAKKSLRRPRTETLQAFVIRMFATWVGRFAAAIVFLLGVIASTWALYGTINGVRELHAQTFPEIRPVASDSSSPFVFPFYVKNPSNWFDMIDASFICLINSVKYGDLYINDITFTLTLPKTIKKASTINFSCDFRGIFTPVKDERITAINVKIQTNYKISLILYHIDRSHTSDQLEWTTTTGRWIEGEYAK